MKARFHLEESKEGYGRLSIRFGNRVVARLVAHPNNHQLYIDLPATTAASYMRPIPDDGKFEGCVLLNCGDLQRDCENAYEHVHLRMEKRTPKPTTQECTQECDCGRSDCGED